MLDHHANDLDMLPVGVHGRVIVVEGNQFKHLLPVLIDAAGTIRCEVAVIATHHRLLSGQP